MSNTQAKTNHSIKHRIKPNDKIYTPLPLVDIHTNMVYDAWYKYYAHLPSKTHPPNILDPCKGDGAYYDNLDIPYHHRWYGKKDYCEIEEGKDFFEYSNKDNQIIIGNLPFSLCDKFIKKSIELDPLIISYLMPIHALTPKRLELLEKNNYKLIQHKMFKWHIFMGMCVLATFGKEVSYSINNKQFGEKLQLDYTYDRTVWYKREDWIKKKKKKKEKEYIASLDADDKKALKIAQKQLGDSFNLEKSIGFKNYLISTR